MIKLRFGKERNGKLVADHTATCAEVAADYLGNYSWLEQRSSVGEKQEMAGRQAEARSWRVLGARR